jgi:glycosyltransferase involved in cell wall biosynthesis
MNPTFSIIMTSYNYEAYIGAAIESVLSQTFADWELIIIDDCSSDGSWGIIQSFNDARIKSYRHEINLGACAAYNRALSMAHGDFIASLDSDDMYLPHKLERQASFLKAHPEIDICGSYIIETAFDGSINAGPKEYENWFNISIDLNKPDNWLWQNRLCHSGTVVKSELHRRVGAFSDTLKYTPDWQFWIRCLIVGAQFSVLQERLVCYRNHGSNITHKSASDTLLEHAKTGSTILLPWLLVSGNTALVDQLWLGFLQRPELFSVQELQNGVGNFFATPAVADSTVKSSIRLATRMNTELEGMLYERAEALSDRDAALSDRDAALSDRDAALSDRDAALSDRDAALSDRDAAMSERNAALSDRDAAMSERNAAMSERNAAMSERDAALSDRDAALSESAEALSERDAALSELYMVYRSKSWRYTKLLRFVATKAKSLEKISRWFFGMSSRLLILRRLNSSFRLLLSGDLKGLRSASSSVLRAEIKLLNRENNSECISPSPLLKDQPLVSVIIPCFNYGKYVVGAIDSVLAQTLRDIEIIVVDGGSTDNETHNILKTAQRPKTRILFRDGRHLVGDNRNYGIELARGRYICCLDADDTLDATYLEKAVFYLESYGYDIVSTAINFVGARDGHVDILEYPDLSDMADGNHILTCGVFRKLLWESVGGYVDVGIGKYHVAEDWDFWLRLAAKGARIRNIAGEYLFNYRIHEGGSLSSSADVMPLSKQRDSILERNHHVLTPEAYKFSKSQQSRSFWCDPTLTALASSSYQDAHKMTLLLAVPFFLVGGAERLLSGLCEYLVNNGWRIIVISTLPQEPGYGTSVNWFKAHSSEVYELTKFLQPKEYKDFIKYLIASRKSDCLFNAGSQLIYEMLPEIKEENKNLCVVDCLFNTEGHVKSHITYRKFMSSAFAENQEVFDWLLNTAGWSADQIRKMSSGVDLVHFQPNVRPKFLVDKYGISESDLVVGFSGRLSEEKGPDIFVEIAKLCQGTPNLRFVMTGAGPMSAVLMRQIELLPASVKFEFAGLVENVEPYLALYDVLILPSRVDGRPLVVMEAQAYGLPVIASHVGALPELIEDGCNGYLISIGNANLFAARIKELAENRLLLERLKVGARNAAEIKMDAKKAHYEYDVALREVIEINRSTNVHMI